jgi:SAM-dependent methyltransferase
MTAGEGPRFQEAPRAAVRAPVRWNRLAHIARALPAGILELTDQLAAQPRAAILDYGSADSPYRDFFPPDARWVTADLPGNSASTITLRPDGTVPVEDGAFDIVLSTQVLEHVEDPALYLAECQRVLRPGGQLLLSTHGLMVYHPDPDDYWRWTCAGLQRAVTAAGFRIARFEGIMGLAATGLQLFQDAWYWKLPRPLRPCFALVFQAAIAVMDRIQRPGSKRLNALVFALVAERP